MKQIGIWNPAETKKLIKMSGFTRAKIAMEVGISARTLTNILNGQKPSYPVLILLAQILGCTVEKLAKVRGRAA